MKKKERACFTDGAAKQATEKAAALAGNTTISNNNFTMRTGTIASILCEGRENALTGREIKRILCLKDGRGVTALVEKERRRGVPICATTNSERPGYFLPGSPDELAEYNRSLRKRIKNITATLTATEKAFDTWVGQMRLDDLGDGRGAE